MNVCVFCSASDVEEKYVKATEEFAKLLGERKHTLVWGGTNRGLMNILANGVRAAGGKLVGIPMELLSDRFFIDPDEQIVAATLGERKQKLLERADVIVVLVGGMGTLDEITEILELKKHRVHEKPVVILNTDNFYEGFKVQLEKMRAEGFLPRPVEEFAMFAETPEEAMRYIDSHGN